MVKLESLLILCSSKLATSVTTWLTWLAISVTQKSPLDLHQVDSEEKGWSAALRKCTPLIAKQNQTRKPPRYLFGGAGFSGARPEGNNPEARNTT